MTTARRFQRNMINVIGRGQNRVVLGPTPVRDPIVAARGVGTPEAPVAAAGGGGGPVSPLVEIARTEQNVTHTGAGATCEILEAVIVTITYQDAEGKQYQFVHQVQGDG